MAIDKHNSLQFLLFGQPSYFEEFGDVDGVYVDRVPFELRARLLRWTWPARNRGQYFFQHAGRDVITREGWEAFVRWVGCAMDRQLGAEYNDPKEAEATTQSVLALKGLVRCPSAPVTTEAMNMWSAQRMEANTVASQASAAARARGRAGGRKPKLDAQQVREIRRLLTDPTIPVSQIADRYKVSRTTIYKVASKKTQAV